MANYKDIQREKRDRVVQRAIEDLSHKMDKDSYAKAIAVAELTKSFCQKLNVSFDDGVVKVISLLTSVVPPDGLKIENITAFTDTISEDMLAEIIKANADSPVSAVALVICRTYYNIDSKKVIDAISGHDVPMSIRSRTDLVTINYIANKVWQAINTVTHGKDGRIIMNAFDEECPDSLKRAYELTLELDVKYRMSKGKRLPIRLIRAWNNVCKID